MMIAALGSIIWEKIFWALLTLKELLGGKNPKLKVLINPYQDYLLCCRKPRLHLPARWSSSRARQLDDAAVGHRTCHGQTSWEYKWNIPGKKIYNKKVKTNHTLVRTESLKQVGYFYQFSGKSRNERCFSTAGWSVEKIAPPIRDAPFAVPNWVLK